MKRRILIIIITSVISIIILSQPFSANLIYIEKNEIDQINKKENEESIKSTFEINVGTLSVINQEIQIDIHDETITIGDVDFPCKVTVITDYKLLETRDSHKSYRAGFQLDVKRESDSFWCAYAKNILVLRGMKKNVEEKLINSCITLFKFEAPGTYKYLIQVTVDSKNGMDPNYYPPDSDWRKTKTSKLTITLGESDQSEKTKSSKEIVKPLCPFISLLYKFITALRYKTPIMYVI